MVMPAMDMLVDHPGLVGAVGLFDRNHYGRHAQVTGKGHLLLEGLNTQQSIIYVQQMS